MKSEYPFYSWWNSDCHQQSPLVHVIGAEHACGKVCIFRQIPSSDSLSLWEGRASHRALMRPSLWHKSTFTGSWSHWRHGFYLQGLGQPHALPASLPIPRKWGRLQAEAGRGSPCAGGEPRRYHWPTSVLLCVWEGS